MVDRSLAIGCFFAHDNRVTEAEADRPAIGSNHAHFGTVDVQHCIARKTLDSQRQITATGVSSLKRWCRRSSSSSLSPEGCRNFPKLGSKLMRIGLPGNRLSDSHCWIANAGRQGRNCVSRHSTTTLAASQRENKVFRFQYCSPRTAPDPTTAIKSTIEPGTQDTPDHLS